MGKTVRVRDKDDRYDDPKSFKSSSRIKKERKKGSRLRKLRRQTKENFAEK